MELDETEFHELVEGTLHSSGSSSSSSSSGGGASCSESEEDKLMVVSEMKPPPPPDPSCLLCGEPAAVSYYDVEGNVIKRESPSSVLLLQADGKGDHDHCSSFIKCIFKCFRVDESRIVQWRNTGGNNGAALPLLLPVCVSCEELVVLLLEMYDKVEELENRIRRKTREAEDKFLEGEEDLRRPSYGGGGGGTGALRKLLLVGDKHNNAQQQVRKTTEGRKRNNRTLQGQTAPMKSSGVKPKKAKKQCSRLYSNLEPLRDPLCLESTHSESEEADADISDIPNILCAPSLVDSLIKIQNNEQELFIMEDEEDCFVESGTTIIGEKDYESSSSSSPAVSFPESSSIDAESNPPLLSETETSGGRQRSRRNRHTRIINYAECSSPAEEDDDNETDDEDEVPMDTIDSDDSSSSESTAADDDDDDEDVKPEFEDINKGQENNLRKPNKRADSTSTIKSNNKAIKTRKEIKRNKGTAAQKQLGRPRRLPSSSAPNTRRIDKISQVDPITGNFSYSYTVQARRSTSTPTSRPSASSSRTTTTTLEFVKLKADDDNSFSSSSSYRCSSCSETISFEGNIIDRLPLVNHVGLFHPCEHSGVCPVCAKPVLSLRSRDYYSHRLSHLSQSERTEALSNPCRQGRANYYPRLPPLPTRRRITSPECASLHGDVNQCTSCGRFVANGAQGLRRHELTHLSEAEKKAHLHLCAACGAAFTTKYSLDIHTIRNHPEGGGQGEEGEGEGMTKLYKCQVCKLQSRPYKTEKALEAHMRKGVHDGAFPKCKCPKCSKSFSTRRALQKHQVCDTAPHANASPKPKSSRSSNLGTTWSCHIGPCQRKFGSKEERLEHYKEAHPKSKIAKESRTPNESVRCEYPKCKQGFPDEASLRSHVSQGHAAGGAAGPATGFMCSLCGKVVSKQCVLKQHHLIHSGERRHVCEVCQASFPIRSSLLSHLASKHGLGPLSGTFRCEQAKCDKVFQCRVQFKHHMRMVHKMFDGGRHPRKE